MEYTISQELQTFIDVVYKAVTPSYSLNDVAHGIDHALVVCHTALELNSTFDLQQDEHEIVVAALSHDMFSWTRSNHDKMVYHWLMTLDEEWLHRFRPIQIERIALAAMEHRSSYIGLYSSRLSELIATADRHAPLGQVEELLIRAFGYRGYSLNDTIPLTIVNECIDHVKEKFGTKTKRKFPQLWLDIYEEEYARYRRDVDNITVGSATIRLNLNIDKDK